MSAAVTQPTETTELQQLIAKTRYLGHSDLMIFEVPSRTHPDEVYRVLGDRRNGEAHCHCRAFRFRRSCAHVKAVRFWMRAHAETQAEKQRRQTARWQEDWRGYANMGGALLDL